MEGTAKLHGFRRCLLGDSAIGAAPSVVVDQAVSSASLGYTTDRAEAQAGQVLGLAPWEKADVAEGNLFGELAADEVGGQSGGAVAAVMKGGLQILGRGVRCEEHGSAPGTKRVVEQGCGVRTRRERVEFMAPPGCRANIDKRVAGRKIRKERRPLTKFVRHRGTEGFRSGN